LCKSRRTSGSSTAWSTPERSTTGSSVGSQREDELTLTEAVRFFAMVYVGFADSQIACWDSKFFWKFWRPYGDPQRGHRRERRDGA
jgi:hypothetical protein